MVRFIKMVCGILLANVPKLAQRLLEDRMLDTIWSAAPDQKSAAFYKCVQSAMPHVVAYPVTLLRLTAILEIMVEHDRPMAIHKLYVVPDFTEALHILHTIHAIELTMCREPATADVWEITSGFSLTAFGKQLLPALLCAPTLHEDIRNKESSPVNVLRRALRKNGVIC